ncbi:MAG: signal peptidase I [Actinomycetota bacterium]|nr:signal peptidase I [Actinomycetota bacterium]
MSGPTVDAEPDLSGDAPPAADAPSLDPSPSRRRRRTGRARRLAIEWAAILLAAAALALVLRTYVVQAFYVPSGSMEPTLQVGDRILVDKIGFSLSTLRDGDVVVFARPPGDVAGVCDDPTAADLVKRVVALPGQTIRSVGSSIVVDGVRQPEPYLPPGTVLGRRVPFQRVPPGRYYVMGDNRSQSCDSRYWGTIKGSTIVGRVFAVVWRHGRPTYRGV